MMKPKVSNLLSLVKVAIEAGKYRYTGHAEERLQLKLVTRLEVKQALFSGYHEQRKDKFDEDFGEWNYSIHGKTLDERELRIVVSFEEALLIITIIDLDK
ncbi:MAG: hypothetical protein Fur0010_28160 [Bdellovibrio sp.]